MNGDEATSGPKPPQLAPGFNIWWDSQEAIKLFNASKEKETAIDRLEDLIAVLENANSTALSYKTIVEGHDADDTMSEHKKEGIRIKASLHRLTCTIESKQATSCCVWTRRMHREAVSVHAKELEWPKSRAGTDSKR